MECQVALRRKLRRKFPPCCGESAGLICMTFPAGFNILGDAGDELAIIVCVS